MEALEHFGVDPILIAAQIINFLVILYILKRFLYKPLFATFKKREALAKESIEKAEQARIALEKAQQEEAKLIKKAKATADQMLKDAKEQAEAFIAEAQSAAQKQSVQIIADAKIQIARETKLAEQQLNKYVAELAVTLLEKSIDNVFTDKEQTTIVERAVKELKKPNN